MKTNDSHSTWIEVDLDAIAHNVSLIKDRSGVQVMAVVKANAYGHGSIPAALAALRGGAKWLGVARVEEALQLRAAQINCPILVMGYSSRENLEEAIANGISLTLWNREQLQLVSHFAEDAHFAAKVHLKVDTGMSRLGVAPENALSLAVEISNAHSVTFEGIFTHFARADELNQSSAEAQELEFMQVLKSLAAAGIKPPLVHVANSAAALFRPTSRFDIVRPGIAIYGLHPSDERPLPGEFEGALGWKAVLSQVKTLPPGRGISYGHEYVTRKNERIGTVPVGYADGFRRAAGNQVLVGGKQVPVIGRVCMDQVIIQLDEVPEANPGDEVVLIGSQGDSQITAEQVADLWGTINYEVVCGIAARVPRIYRKSSD